MHWLLLVSIGSICWFSIVFLADLFLVVFTGLLLVVLAFCCFLLGFIGVYWLGLGFCLGLRG